MTRTFFDWRLSALLLGAVLCALAFWAMTIGSASYSITDVAQALADPKGESRETLIVWTVRLPRILAAITAGAALAAAGAIMQAATGNPLADPGLLGVNAGAALAVVVMLVILGPSASRGFLIWAAFGGAALAAIAVYGLGTMGRSGATPIKLVLAGVVIGTFLGVLTASLLIFDSQTLDAVRLWTAGSLAGRDLGDVLSVVPYVLLGLALAVMFRDQFTSLSLGTDVAQGLGQNPALWRGVSAIVVVLLAGGAVAISGPLGFIGLVIPHMVRLTHGADYRHIIPLTILGGAILTLAADVLPRAIWGVDVPVGISMALIGAPFFIWLARGRLGPIS